MLVQKHPIHGAISLIGVMASLAMLYLILGGEFIAAAQVIVYAGAIMVLFVFVIMLLNAGREGPSRQPRMVRWLGIPVFVGFLTVLGYVARRVVPPGEGVRFGAFTGGDRARGRYEAVHRVSAALRVDFGPGVDRHPGRHRSGPEGDRLR